MEHFFWDTRIFPYPVRKTLMMKNYRHMIQRIKIIGGILNSRIPFTGPMACMIALTDACNIQCSFCPVHSSFLTEERKNKFRDSFGLEELKSLLRQLRDLHVCKLFFAGRGEPFSYPYIRETLDYCRHLGLETNFTTNGTLIDSSLMQDLIRLGVKELNVSICAGSPEHYVRVHPHTSEETFLRIKGWLHDSLRFKRRPRIVITNIICNKNSDDIENMVRLAKEARAQEVRFEPVQLFDYIKEDLRLSPPQKSTLLASSPRISTLLRTYRLKSNFSDMLKRLTHDVRGEGRYNYLAGKISCYQGWLTCGILASGDVIFCCESTRHIIGNIYRSPFKEIWFSAEYNTLRHKALTQGCIYPDKRQTSCFYALQNLMLHRCLRVPEAVRKNV